VVSKSCRPGKTNTELAGVLASLAATSANPRTPAPDTQQRTNELAAKEHFEKALRYANGSGVKQDYAEAAKWYRLAAEANHSEAQRNLGFLYANGKGVPRDPVEAEKWLQKSSSQGNSSANLANVLVLLSQTNLNPSQPVAPSRVQTNTLLVPSLLK
jgi:TPR repeat protein